MKVRNLLDKLNSLIAPDRNGDKQRIRHLSAVMSALTDKQQQLLEQLKKTEDDKVRHKILIELEVIRRQKEKGDEVYRAARARMESRSRAAPLFDSA